MRKLLWLGAAALFSGLCGFCYVASEYPGSGISQATKSMVALSYQVNPLARLVSRAPSQGNTLAKGAAATAEENIAPPEPRPISPHLAQDSRSIDPGRPASEGERISIQFHADRTVARKNSEPPSTPLAPSALPSLEKTTQTVAIFEETAPRVMPHATDEDENSDVITQSIRPEKTDYVGQSTAHYSDLKTHSSKKPSASLPGSGTAPITAAQMEQSVPFHDYHAQMMVCPYTGRCLEMPRSESTGSENKSVDPGSSEESEMEWIGPPQEEPESPPHHTSHKMSIPGSHLESDPSHPMIDTMEYRPGDGNLGEYKPGPI